MNTKKSRKEVANTILRIIEEENPETTTQLIKLISNEISISEREILHQILSLEEEGKLQLRTRPPSKYKNSIRNLASSQFSWYWTILILALTTAITTFTIPENIFPIAYVRYLFGSIFILWLPGYAFIKALFPRKKELDNIERAALSVGMSIALVAIMGLLLNYTPLGISLTPLTLTLLAMTVLFATVAIVKEYQPTRATGD